MNNDAFVYPKLCNEHAEEVRAKARRRRTELLRKLRAALGISCGALGFMVLLAVLIF